MKLISSCEYAATKVQTIVTQECYHVHFSWLSRMKRYTIVKAIKQAYYYDVQTEELWSAFIRLSQITLHVS